MKTITFSALLLLATISFSSFEVPSLTNSVSKVTGIDNFRVHRQGRDISLTWSCSGPAQTFVVERSEDGEFFDPIHSTDNIGARSYKHLDGTYFPGTIYYRIACVYADGTKHYSAVRAIKILQRG
jgi:hypothetical protein